MPERAATATGLLLTLPTSPDCAAFGRESWRLPRRKPAIRGPSGESLRTGTVVRTTWLGGMRASATGIVLSTRSKPPTLSGTT